MTQQAAYAPASAEGLAASVAELTALAQRHLRDATARIGVLPTALHPVFLPLAATGPLLARVSKAGATILQRGVALPDLELLARMGWATLRLRAGRRQRT